MKTIYMYFRKSIYHDALEATIEIDDALTNDEIQKIVNEWAVKNTEVSWGYERRSERGLNWAKRDFVKT